MEQTQDKTLTATMKTIHKPNNFEDEHRGVEGPMGRPAFFRGVTPGDLDTEGTTVPPIKGTPPRRRSTNSRAGKRSSYPRRNGLSSSPTLLTKTSTGTDRPTHMKHHKYHILSHNTPHINADNDPNTQPRQSGFRGVREEAAEPNYPPPPNI